MTKCQQFVSQQPPIHNQTAQEGEIAGAEALFRFHNANDRVPLWQAYVQGKIGSCELEVRETNLQGSNISHLKCSLDFDDVPLPPGGICIRFLVRVIFQKGQQLEMCDLPRATSK